MSGRSYHAHAVLRVKERNVTAGVGGEKTHCAKVVHECENNATRVQSMCIHRCNKSTFCIQRMSE